VDANGSAVFDKQDKQRQQWSVAITSLSFFFLRTPLNASIMLKWKSWRTSDNAQDFDAIILFEPCSRAETSTSTQRHAVFKHRQATSVSLAH